MEKIKLVIWDLDDTFWKGTLSEGQIELDKKNIHIVKTLSERGIINSISSKNNFNDVKNILISANIWDYFIFPTIEWEPKGVHVKNIIDKCQLRAENVLFIDDNHLNLEEVLFYNPNIHIKFPSFIPEILNNPAFKGKKDFSLSRLNQYKLLEKRAFEKDKKIYTNNEDFLRSSEIKIHYINNLFPIKDRIYELLDRTNQLNFTKRRISQSDVDKLINNNFFEQCAIQVQDKYGDYGIVGYYCLNKQENRLEHFVFSCRILNLGVEQFVYSKLNYPNLEIIGDVSSSLNKNYIPDWISIKKKDLIINNSSNKNKIFFKGGCDLLQMLHYLHGNGKVSIIPETNYMAKNNFPIYNDHTQSIIDSIKLSKDKKQYLINSLPFVDENYYKTKLFTSNYDVLVFSVMMDYTQELYMDKEDGTIIPLGGYYDYLTDENRFSLLIDKYKKIGVDEITLSFLKNFRNKYEHIGQISTDNFIKNLQFINEKINKPIIFINGAELKSPTDDEKGAFERHKLMNDALKKFVVSQNQCYLVDVTKIVNHSSLITNNIRHYKREVYQELSKQIQVILENELDLVIQHKKINPIRLFSNSTKNFIKRNILRK